nr:MAG TPA: hypothetical protein [Caudoviricetes sp.]
MPRAWALIFCLCANRTWPLMTRESIIKEQS